MSAWLLLVSTTTVVASAAGATAAAAALAAVAGSEGIIAGNWASVGDVVGFIYDSKNYAAISTAGTSAYTTADILVELVGVTLSGVDIAEFATS